MPQLEILIQCVWGWAQKSTLLNSSPGNSDDHLLVLGITGREELRAPNQRDPTPNSSIQLLAV